MSKQSNIRWLKSSLLIAVVAGIVLTGFASWRFGSVGAAVARMRGEVLYVKSRTIELPTVRAGEKAPVTVTIRNVRSTPVRILGARMSCSCASPMNLPLTLAPYEEQNLKFEVYTVKSDAGTTLRESATLLTNPAARAFTLGFRLDVVKNSRQNKLVSVGK